MKNLYCSFLNSSEASISDNRLIYQEHQREKPPRIEAGSTVGANEEGSGLFDLARRGQKEILKEIQKKAQKEILKKAERFLNFVERIDFLKHEAEFLGGQLKHAEEEASSNYGEFNPSPRTDIPRSDFVERKGIVHKERMAIVEELNDIYKIGLDLDKPGINIETTDDGNIVIMARAPRDTLDKIIIRLDGTLVKTNIKPSDSRADYFSYNLSGDGKMHILPEGKKAPDEF